MSDTAPTEPLAASTPVDEPSVSVEPTLAELMESMESLNDLFKRRLLQDRQKQEMYDKLYAELETARKAADAVQSLPLLRDLMHVLDRFDRYQGSDAEFVDHATQELLELLRRQGVEPIALQVGAPFDPAICEVIETQLVEDEAWHSLVLQIVRRGYRQGERVLRPAHVILAQSGPLEIADEPTELV